MQILRNKDLVPPDNFRYVHSETGHRSEASDYWTWQGRIAAHRKANNLPVVSAAEAENQLCQQLPPSFCSQSDPNRPWVDIRFTLGDVADVMKVFVSFAASGFQFVSQEEANRRARICVGCYNNINVSGCGACRQLAGFITGSLAQRKTSHDDALKVCGVCRCLNRAQVHVPLEALDTKDSPEKQALYPSFCWLKNGGENYEEAA